MYILWTTKCKDQHYIGVVEVLALTVAYLVHINFSRCHQPHHRTVYHRPKYGWNNQWPNYSYMLNSVNPLAHHIVSLDLPDLQIRSSSVPSYFREHCLPFVNWTLANKLDSSYIIIIAKKYIWTSRLQNSGHLFRPQCVKRTLSLIESKYISLTRRINLKIISAKIDSIIFLWEYYGVIILWGSSIPNIYIAKLKINNGITTHKV